MFPHHPSVNYSQYIIIAFSEKNALHIRTSRLFFYLLHLWRCPVVSDISFAWQLHDTLMITKVSEWPIFLILGCVSQWSRMMKACRWSRVAYVKYTFLDRLLILYFVPKKKRRILRLMLHFKMLSTPHINLSLSSDYWRLMKEM